VVESVEAAGRTVDEAVENALDDLGLERDEVTVTVLSDGSDGQPARVSVMPREDLDHVDDVDDVDDFEDDDYDDAAGVAMISEEGEPFADLVEDVLAEILEQMELPSEIQIDASTIEEDLPTVHASIHGEFGGILIGRRGETLSALQFIVQLIASRRAERRVRVLLDVEGYRERRARMLRDMAHRAADRAQRYRQPVFMDPMQPSERRIIHMALADHPSVSTHSVGEGDGRRVVVSPRQAQRFGGYRQRE
jgi:spoIIIJ-associated protein